MTKEEAMFKCQHELWDKGPFFQTEMAQYAEQLAFEKGIKFIIEKACEWLEHNFNMPNDFRKHFIKAMEE